MEAIRHSLNIELAHDLPPLDSYAQHILENRPTIGPIIEASTQINSSNDILQKIGATLINAIQLKQFNKIDNSPAATTTTIGDKMMDIYGLPQPSNHIVIDSSGFESMDELQRQLEYDKFMNEVWIGIVLTLILISLIFCICSCLLYHQFRAWKRNYRNTASQSLNDLENETRKLYTDIDDPVPEYTLVSGLPSYEAALELLNKSPQSCVIVHPSVLSVFHVNEKNTNEQLKQQQQQQHQPHIQQTSEALEVITTPLLPSSHNGTHQNQTTPTTTTTMPNNNILMAGKVYAPLPTYEEANSQNKVMCLTNVTMTTVSEKYEQLKEKKHENLLTTITDKTSTISSALEKSDC